MDSIRTLALKTRPATACAGVALAVLILAGGGDFFSPLAEAAAQTGTALAFLVWFWTIPRSEFVRIPCTAWAIAGLVIALPLLQLVPLPPQIWHSLPGRDIQRMALRLVGQENSWRPFTIVPDRTLASALAAATAAMVLVMVAALGRRGRAAMLFVIGLCAGLSLLVGAEQLIGQNESIFNFYLPEIKYLQGFQMNHNSEGDFLLVAMLAFTALVADMRALKLMRGRRRWIIGLTGVATAALAMGVVLTASRSSIALIAPVLIAQLVILRRPLNLNLRTFALSAVTVIVAAGLSLAVVSGNDRIQRALSRFDITEEFRPEVWDNALFATKTYAPYGAGMGAFVPTYKVAERLEGVSPGYASRAYNDYLELALEAGVPGVLLLVIIVALLAWGGWQSRRNPLDSSRPQLAFAVFTLGVFAVHSVIDYPVRSMSLAAVAATAAALLLRRRPIVVEVGA